MIKGIERVVPILRFQLRGVEVRVHGVRQDVTPRMKSITYEIEVDSDEHEARLALLHDNVKKYGTIFNTVAPGSELSGRIMRKRLHSAINNVHKKCYWLFIDLETNAKSCFGSINSDANSDAFDRERYRCHCVVRRCYCRLLLML